MHFLGRLLKIDQLESIERMDLSLTAPWAQRYAPWLVPAFLALCCLAVFDTRGVGVAARSSRTRAHVAI